MLTMIDHIGVAVEDIDAALPYYLDVLQVPLVHRETVADQGVERIAPLGPETGVAKYLAKRGPGLHHVAYRVEDIDSVLGSLAASGVRLIDERPRVGIRGSRVAFLHPASSGGVLTEIVEPAAGH